LLDLFSATTLVAFGTPIVTPSQERFSFTAALFQRGEMIQNLVLISETPETHQRLVRSLAADRVEVIQLQSVSAAASLLSNLEITSLAIVLDAQSISESDARLLVDLSTQHPGLSLLVFLTRQPVDEIRNRLQSSPRTWIFTRPLSDAASQLAVLQLISIPADQQASTGAEVANSGRNDTSSHEKFGPRQLQTMPQGATPSLYDEDFLRRVGLSDVPVLLHGETGAGKEVMARKLWGYSNRVGKPFLKLNCAALPSELIESELFGYEKGAFTGAIVDKPGKFELAQDGTILLDEIGDMDTRLQAKLLQVLQDGQVQPLGSSRTIDVNVRIMAATHRDLPAAIAQGTFREDLYYRLSVINITIPPLRDRREEIIPLAEYLLFRHVGPGALPPAIPEVLRRAMLAHSWPGNVRELENVMRRFLVYQDAQLLACELSPGGSSPKLHLEVARTPTVARTPVSTGRVSFDHFAESSRTAESKLLLETLEAVRWNRRQAAIQLKLDYKALLYKLQKHGIVESKTKRREVSA
jgi:DNA-binding NtrC family response regulator